MAFDFVLRAVVVARWWRARWWSRTGFERRAGYLKETGRILFCNIHDCIPKRTYRRRKKLPFPRPPAVRTHFTCAQVTLQYVHDCRYTAHTHLLRSTLSLQSILLIRFVRLYTIPPSIPFSNLLLRNNKVYDGSYSSRTALRQMLFSMRQPRCSMCTEHCLCLCSPFFQ